MLVEKNSMRNYPLSASASTSGFETAVLPSMDNVCSFHKNRGKWIEILRSEV
jgi:hypothetical protein